MRDIKFRVYDYVQTFSWEKLCELNAQGELLLHEILNCDNVITMQYTGIKDCDGVEIYEGDIVTSMQIVKNYEVKYGKYLAAQDGFYCLFAKGFYIEYDGFGCLVSSNMEVVGTIYENPELLQ